MGVMQIDANGPRPTRGYCNRLRYTRYQGIYRHRRELIHDNNRRRSRGGREGVIAYMFWTRAELLSCRFSVSAHNWPKHSSTGNSSVLWHTLWPQIAQDACNDRVSASLCFAPQTFSFPTGLIPQTLGPFSVFILLNGWICLHGVHGLAKSALSRFHLKSMHFISFHFQDEIRYALI